MNISQNCIELIKQFEGFSSNVYLDSAGYKTIGYGHMLKKGEDFIEISVSQAEALLLSDIKWAEDSVNRNVSVPISQNQLDALTSFTYNVGSGALQRSTLRRKLNRYSYNEIPNEILRWTKSGGKTLQGLVNRRKAEASLFQNIL